MLCDSLELDCHPSAPLLHKYPFYQKVKIDTPLKNSCFQMTPFPKGAFHTVTNHDSSALFHMFQSKYIPYKLSIRMSKVSNW